MCVISMKPFGQKISEDIFQKMWERNQDGMGYIARLKGGEFKVKKGIMDYKQALEDIKPYLGEDAETLVHLRIKSRGGITPNLTHPFDFSNDKSIRYLCHNGSLNVISSFTDQAWSDSRFLAETILKYCDDKSVDKILKELSSTNNGRFVTFIQKRSENGDEEGKFEIYGDSQSEWKDGCWFSNLIHLEPKKFQQQNFGGYCGVGTHYNHQPKPHVKIHHNEAERKPLLKIIIDFYKTKKNGCSDEQIIEDYSLELVKTKFLEDICEIIKIGQDDDPIVNFFNQI